jgi:hypothetical protein
VHLVDFDAEALARAYTRLPASSRTRVVLHAPIDLSGMLEHLPDWKACHMGPEDIVRWPLEAVGRFARKVGSDFDVVASTCVLSQLQWGVVQALGEEHPLFHVVRYTLNVVHLRTIARLLASHGQGLLITDVAADPAIDARNVDDTDALALLGEQAARERFMYATHPSLLQHIFADDPTLASRATLSPPISAWLWRNGPDRTFLVYALAMQVRSRAV